MILFLEWLIVRTSAVVSIMFPGSTGAVMKYVFLGHRDGDLLVHHDESLCGLWSDIDAIISELADEAIIGEFTDSARNAKSISEAINTLLKRRFIESGWVPESPIFADTSYLEGKRKGTWRLDFAKDGISVEVAFNHRSDIAWNLVKPVLAGELNHVEKAVQTKLGVIITATEALKRAGGFDPAVGTFEDYCQYLVPLRSLLTVPLVIVGLEAPETFEIVVVQARERQKVGQIKRLGE